jgi:predicted DNA-binding protein
MQPDQPDNTASEDMEPHDTRSVRQREHTLVVRITYDAKDRIDQLALKLDRTNSDIVRMILRLGLPLLESLSDAEQQVVREYTDIFRKLRQMRSLRDI